MNNDDPERRMRLQLSVPSIFGEGRTCWAEACVPSADTPTPANGTQVWIQFERGDPARPVWTGIVVSAVTSQG